MSNCASLLFRLDVAGQNCGDRWAELVKSCRHLAEDRALTFSDVHMIVALSMAKEGTALNQLARDLSAYSNSGATFDQMASARLSMPLAKAMVSRRPGTPKVLRIHYSTPDLIFSTWAEVSRNAKCLISC